MADYKATALEKRLVSQPKYDNKALARFIHLPDGTKKTIEQCTNQEFDDYVRSILRQLYANKGSMLKAYKNFSDLDWADKQDRLYALNQLDALIDARKISLWGKQEVDVRLFVE